MRPVSDATEGTVKVYVAARAGAVTGLAYELSGPGYSGQIRVLLGIAPDGTLLGVRVLSHTETPGLGDKIELAKDDWMMLCYASGNRDEEVFDDPAAFKVDRKPNKHLAFGYGAHLCLGQHLAKMEMRILWEELLPRIQSLELAEEPKLSQATFVSGPKTLPVRFSMH